MRPGLPGQKSSSEYNASVMETDSWKPEARVAARVVFCLNEASRITRRSRQGGGESECHGGRKQRLSEARSALHENAFGVLAVWF